MKRKKHEERPTEEELRGIFQEERERLGLPDDIELRFLQEIPSDYYESLSHWWIVHNRESTQAVREDDGSFYVQFNPFSFRNAERFRKTARHELYHIYRNGNRERTSLMKYLFIDEPTAMIYARWGLKL